MAEKTTAIGQRLSTKAQAAEKNASLLRGLGLFSAIGGGIGLGTGNLVGAGAGFSTAAALYGRAGKVAADAKATRARGMALETLATGQTPMGKLYGRKAAADDSQGADDDDASRHDDPMTSPKKDATGISPRARSVGQNVDIQREAYESVLRGMREFPDKFSPEMRAWGAEQEAKPNNGFVPKSAEEMQRTFDAIDSMYGGRTDGGGLVDREAIKDAQDANKTRSRTPPRTPEKHEPWFDKPQRMGPRSDTGPLGGRQSFAAADAARFETANAAYSTMQAVNAQTDPAQGQMAGGPRGWANPGTQMAAQLARGVVNVTDWAASGSKKA